MPDSVPGDTTTTATLGVGSYVDATIETSGDRDWYAVTLVAGRRYSFSANAVPNSNTTIDSYLRLYNSAGTLLLEDDDGGPGAYSEIHFTATASGTFYISAGTYNDNDIGTYRLRVNDTGLDAVAGDTTSTATVALGATVSGQIDTAGDHDFFAVTLVAGQTYLIQTIATGGNQDVDTTIMIRGADGSDHRGSVATDTYGYNDDRIGTYSGIRFTPTTSGTYFIDVGAYNNETTGAYALNLDVAPPLPVYTNDQIATQLTTTYWGGDTHHFNVAPGGSLTVNLTDLDAAAQTLARAALALWTDVSGIAFAETTATTAQITFVNDEAGAFTTARYSGGITTSARVNISQQWVDDYGTSLNSYTLQTFVHEIGHALGLGHGGDYNGDAAYASDALYQNDAWITTVMSYFDERENTYFAGQGFSRQFTVTPMVADILAITSLYGIATGTRTDNTTYGFNSTANRAIFDAANPSGTGVPAYTIIDNGGIDTLDYSGYAANQTIDLNPERFSSIGGRVGNVSIARGTVIENAIGGSGNDRIFGNAADNVLTGGGGQDTLTGGGGNDTFADTIGRINGDTITDLSYGDRIVISRTSLQGFGFSQRGQTLTISTSSATASSIVTLTTVAANARLVASATTDGGVALVWATNPVNQNDFNGDGTGDVLFRSSTGMLASWKVASPTNIAGNGTGNIADPGASNRLAAVGDINGDGTADLLFRGRDGTISAWQLNGTVITSGGTIGNPGAAYALVDTGDFNGDGRADLLFYNGLTGAYATWNMNGTVISGGGTLGNPGAGYVFKAVADFNGDGKADVLFENVDGTYASWTLSDTAITGGGNIGDPGPSWFFKGTGDFNGDGMADILFENADGTYATWDVNGTAITGGGTIGNPGATWTLAGIGDYNSDGKSDLLFRNANGTVATWTLGDTAITGGGTLGDPGSAFSIADGHGPNTFTSLIFQHTDGTVASWLVGGGVRVGGATIGNPGADYMAKAVADFGGTGGTDVLFQASDGTLALWKTDGSSLITGGIIGNAGANYTFRAVGDFNGDGKADILFQHENGNYATWDLSGTAIIGGGTIGVAAGYSFVATGDLNGDGRSDILFRDANGSYAMWFLDNTAIIGGGTIGNPGPNYTFEGLGDFNGDGKADILFKATDGTYASWDLDGTSIIGGGNIGNPGGTFDLTRIADINGDGKADLIFENAAGHHAAWLIDDTHILQGANLGDLSAGFHMIG